MSSLGGCFGLLTLRFILFKHELELAPILPANQVNMRYVC